MFGSKSQGGNLFEHLFGKSNMEKIEKTTCGRSRIWCQKILDNESRQQGVQMGLLKDFSIKPTPTTIKNPQANSILERVHQVLGNMLRTKNLQEYDFDDMDS